MNNLFKIILGFIVGLISTSAFIGICILVIFLADNFGWNKISVYLCTIFACYSVLLALAEEHMYTKIDIVIGAILVSILVFLSAGEELVPLWYYVAINSIIGINITSTCIKEFFKPKIIYNID